MYIIICKLNFIPVYPDSWLLLLLLPLSPSSHPETTGLVLEEAHCCLVALQAVIAMDVFLLKVSFLFSFMDYWGMGIPHWHPKICKWKIWGCFEMCLHGVQGFLEKKDWSFVLFCILLLLLLMMLMLMLMLFFGYVGCLEVSSIIEAAGFVSK